MADPPREIEVDGKVYQWCARVVTIEHACEMPGVGPLAHIFRYEPPIQCAMWTELVQVGGYVYRREIPENERGVH